MLPTDERGKTPKIDVIHPSGKKIAQIILDEVEIGCVFLQNR
jgi:hypothetical protein